MPYKVVSVSTNTANTTFNTLEDFLNFHYSDQSISQIEERVYELARNNNISEADIDKLKDIWANKISTTVSWNAETQQRTVETIYDTKADWDHDVFVRNSGYGFNPALSNNLSSGVITEFTVMEEI